MSGSIGDLNITSFHAAQMLTTGEGAMVFTDDELARRARIIRNHGDNSKRKYEHIMPGHNYRMTDFHAAVGLSQLTKIKEYMKTRRENVKQYTDQLSIYSNVLTLPTPTQESSHSWFIYRILIANRDAVKSHLADRGIETRVTWPIPFHEQPIYRDEHGHESYPVAEKFADHVLSLPTHNQLSKEEVAYVIDHLIDAIDRFVNEPGEFP